MLSFKMFSSQCVCFISKSFKTSRLCLPDHLPYVLEHLGPDQVDTSLVHVLALVVAPASTQYETL